MQIKTLFVAAFIGLAAAQDVTSLIGEIPSCALQCLLSAGTSAGCEATDYKCQCENSSKIQASASSCLTSSCTTQEISKVQQVSTQICTAVGAAPAASGSGSGSSTPKATKTGASATTKASGTSSAATTLATAGAAPLPAGLPWAGAAALLGALVL